LIGGRIIHADVKTHQVPKFREGFGDAAMAND
jgi:hypothetical protein